MLSQSSYFKKYGMDFLYSVMGLICVNGVLQFVIYPYLAHHMGTAAFGVVLSFLSVISIASSTFGTGANYARIMSSLRYKCEDGDYHIYLLLITCFALPISAIVLLGVLGCRTGFFIGYFVLIIVSMFRYFEDVHFRLNVDFRGFFIYHTIIATGYMFGIGLYQIYESWLIIFITGEIAALFYAVKRRYFNLRLLAKRSSQFNDNIKSMLLLSLSSLIVSIIQNADRLVTLNFVGSQEVTIFYAATVIGKSIAILSTPLNGVLIGHLANYQGKLGKREFANIASMAMALGIIATAVSVGVSKIIINIIYPNCYARAETYFWIGNAGQVLYFISGTLMVIVLRFSQEKYQFYVNFVYAVIFVCVLIPAGKLWGLPGIAYGLLLVNFVRYLLAVGIGFLCIPRLKGLSSGRYPNLGPG